MTFLRLVGGVLESLEIGDHLDGSVMGDEVQGFVPMVWGDREKS